MICPQHWPPRLYICGWQSHYLCRVNHSQGFSHVHIIVQGCQEAAVSLYWEVISSSKHQFSQVGRYIRHVASEVKVEVGNSAVRTVEPEICKESVSWKGNAKKKKWGKGMSIQCIDSTVEWVNLKGFYIRGKRRVWFETKLIVWDWKESGINKVHIK